MAFANIIDAATAVDDIHSLRSLVVSPRESISSYAVAPLMILTLAVDDARPPATRLLSSTITTTSTQYHSPPPLPNAPKPQYHPPRVLLTFPPLLHDLRLHGNFTYRPNQLHLPSRPTPPLHHLLSPSLPTSTPSHRQHRRFSSLLVDL